MIGRRAFLGRLAVAIPLAAVVRRADAEAAAEMQRGPETLRALADAILPSELGAAGIAAEVAAFQSWIGEYRENAEVNHAYGSSRVRFSGPTPATRWMLQLDDLETRARTGTGKFFAESSIDERRAIVRQAIPGVNAGIGDVAGASHVALALLAHFYGGAKATDLCYEANVGKETCRTLASSPARPTPLRRAR